MRSQWLRIRAEEWWEQGALGGARLENPAVNLQSVSQSGNDIRQDSSNLTAQLHLVITLRLISNITFFISVSLTTCIFCPPPYAPSSSRSNNLVEVEIVREKVTLMHQISSDLHNNHHLCRPKWEFEYMHIVNQIITHFWNRKPHKEVELYIDVKWCLWRICQLWPPKAMTTWLSSFCCN